MAQLETISKAQGCPYTNGSCNVADIKTKIEIIAYMKVFTIDAGVQSVDLSQLAPFTRWHANHIFFEREMGVEHYRLLAYLSSQCNDGDIIYDIGTYLGYSALAMAHNPKVHVVTYDLVDNFKTNEVTAQDVKNITFKIGNCLHPSDMQEIAKAPLVLLDVDPHDGIQEPHIFRALENAGFKGILLLDDIHLNYHMRSFWDWIPTKYKKVDISRYGHHSGTGLVVFDPSFVDVAVVQYCMLLVIYTDRRR